MEYEKEKIIMGVNNQKPVKEIKPTNVKEKKHQAPHKVFEGYKKSKLKK